MIDIIKTTKERKEFKDAHNGKAATLLGVTQIIFFLFELITYVDMILELRLELESALLLLLICVFFLVSGGLAIAGARQRTKCLIVATRVTSIISAILAGLLLLTMVVVGMLSDHGHALPPQYSMQLFAIGAIRLIIATISVSGPED